LQRVAACWPAFVPPGETLDVYAEALQTYPLDVTMRALEALFLRRTVPYWPTMGEIVSAIREAKAALAPAPVRGPCSHGRPKPGRCDDCVRDIQMVRKYLRERWAAEADGNGVDPDEEARRALAQLQALPVDPRNSCSGTGEPPVQRGDLRVCPGCGAPIEGHGQPEERRAKGIHVA